MPEYVIEIPNYHPPRLNQVRGRHWAAEHKAKGELAEFIRLYAVLAPGYGKEPVPKAAGRRRVRLELEGQPSGRLPDADAFDKLLLDALVQTGLLLDDGVKGLEGRVEVTFTRAPERLTRLILEDCP